MKIIIIDHEPYTIVKKSRYFIEEFSERNVIVEYWCVQKAFAYSRVANYEIWETDSFVKNLDTKALIQKELYKLDANNTIVFFECRQNIDTFFILEYFYKYKIIWARLEYFHNPTIEFLKPIYPQKEADWWGEILRNIEKIFSFNWYKFKIYQKFAKKYFTELNTSNISFITGDNTIGLLLSKKYISLDYFDVVSYNNEQNNSRLLNYEYIIFGDVYLGKHPDLQMIYGSDYIDIEVYYKKMNLFFDRIETYMGIPVIIAAHPKSNYDHEFGNRLIIKNNSTNLIMNCEVYLHHGSLSVCTAMLGNKRIFQLSTSEFEQNHGLSGFRSIMSNLSKKIGTPTISIDQEYDFELLFSQEIGLEKYKVSLEKYFHKSGNDKRDNFTILNSEINKLL